MKRCSELKFKSIVDCDFGGFVKVIWNGRTIYDDADDGLHIDGNWKPEKDIPKAFSKFKAKYGDKAIYSFYCRVVDCHHTEIYIEGENIR